MSAGRQGFSLMELLVAMFISTLIVLTVVAAFASAFRAQKNARNTQKEIEDAKTSLEFMAKIMRMSSNLRPTTAGAKSAIYMFNKSLPPNGKCVGFRYSSSRIYEDSCTPTAASVDNPCNAGDASDCDGGAYATVEITNANLSSAEFYIPTYSVANPIKRITISLQMNNSDNGKMQTTVSLRDYKNINPTGQ